MDLMAKGTYMLVALFIETGETYIERKHLSLQSCAGYAAMLKQETMEVEAVVGEIAYMCLNMEKE